MTTAECLLWADLAQYLVIVLCFFGGMALGSFFGKMIFRGWPK